MVTLKRQDGLWVALCGDVVVFRSLERSTVMRFIEQWNEE